MKLYPTHKLTPGEDVTFRFLTNDQYFFDEFYTHTFDINEGRVDTLCSNVHGAEPCYHCAAAERSFKTGYSREARKYYRQLSFNAPILILDDLSGFSEPNSIYCFSFGRRISLELANVVQELSVDPSDLFNGYNTTLHVKKAHGFKKYTVKFHEGPSPLTDEQIEIVKNTSLDVSEFRPKRLSSEFNDRISADLVWEIMCGHT